jgi:hypothetical protein
MQERGREESRIDDVNRWLAPIGCCVLVALTSVAAGSAVAASRIAFSRIAVRHQENVSDVWVADGSGRHQQMLGPGELPLMAPTGRAVAAELTPPTTGALAVYSPVGGRTQHYPSIGLLGTPLAWSPDSRYLAVRVQGVEDGLYVIDTKLGATTFIGPSTYPTASFAPTLPDRLAYSLGVVPESANVLTAAPDGSGTRELTQNNRSAYPVWGRHGIVFSQGSQIWVMRPNGTHARQVTHARGPFFGGGLTPLYWAPNGRWLMADELVGTVDHTWTVSLRTGAAGPLIVHGYYAYAEGVSSNSRRVLIGYSPGPLQSDIATAPWTGGNSVTILIRGGEQASWNG